MVSSECLDLHYLSWWSWLLCQASQSQWERPGKGETGFKGRHREIGLKGAGLCLGDVTDPGKDPAASLPVCVHREVDKCPSSAMGSLPPSVPQGMHR